MTKKQVWIDESLEDELRKIQEDMKRQLGNVDLSRPQASVIAAKILRESNPNVIAHLIKARKGRRIDSLTLL